MPLFKTAALLFAGATAEAKRLLTSKVVEYNEGFGRYLCAEPSGDDLIISGKESHIDRFIDHFGINAVETLIPCGAI